MSAAIVFLLLGFLLGIVSSIAGNLLTPWTKRLGARALSLQRSSRQGQIRQQLIPLRSELERLNRFSESERDLLVYLFQYLLMIIALIAAGVACTLVARTLAGLTIRAQGNLLVGSLACVLTAVVASLVAVRESFGLTAAGSLKRKAQLEAKIADLNEQLEKL